MATIAALNQQQLSSQTETTIRNATCVYASNTKSGGIGVKKLRPVMCQARCHQHRFASGGGCDTEMDVRCGCDSRGLVNARLQTLQHIPMVRDTLAVRAD
eukprot:199019-Chlamydomonas_euryale.AAC.3